MATAGLQGFCDHGHYGSSPARGMNSTPAPEKGQNSSCSLWWGDLGEGGQRAGAGWEGRAGPALGLRECAGSGALRSCPLQKTCCCCCCCYCSSLGRGCTSGSKFMGGRGHWDWPLGGRYWGGRPLGKARAPGLIMGKMGICKGEARAQSRWLYS